MKCLMGSLAMAAPLSAAACTSMGGEAQVTATSREHRRCGPDGRCSSTRIGRQWCAGAKLDAPQARRHAGVRRRDDRDKIGELIPGGGYMTRLFSKAVGKEGKVYVFNSAPAA